MINLLKNVDGVQWEVGRLPPDGMEAHDREGNIYISMLQMVILCNGTDMIISLVSNVFELFSSTRSYDPLLVCLKNMSYK